MYRDLKPSTDNEVSGAAGPSQERRGERAITPGPAPTVASPGAAARLGPLGATLHSLWELRYEHPDGSPIGPIGLIGRNSLTPVYWCEWWGDTNGDAVWTAAWRGQRRYSIVVTKNPAQRSQGWGPVPFYSPHRREGARFYLFIYQ